MKVLITGACGFVGSHVAEQYVRDGHDVIGLDNLVTGTLQNVTSYMDSTRFRFIDHDVSTEWHAIDGDLRGCDVVLHLASPASPVDYSALPLETMLVNSAGTKNALNFAAASGARFLFASTSESYGDPLVHPQPEGYWGNVNPIGVRSCYDESKRFGEALTMTYIRKNQVDARIVRIFNTYGPRMRRNDGRVVPSFVTQALEGKPLTIYGDGLQTRSFCYVDDLVDGIVRCAESASASGTVINLGNPEEFTIRRFAELVCEIAAVPLKTEARPMPADDPARRCPDISRARELLGWTPKISAREGLQRTIAFFRANPVPA